MPGAARIWFSHNHPSSSPQLSRADEFLNSALTDVFKGSGIVSPIISRDRELPHLCISLRLSLKPTLLSSVCFGC